MADETISIILNYSDRKIPIRVNKRWTVPELYDFVRNKLDESGEFRLASIGVEFDDLNENKRVEEYHLLPGDTIDFIQRVVGGSGLKPLPGYIELTDEPCSVTYDDDPTEKRARMPCGCVISVSAMKTLCVTEINDRKKSVFECPNCGEQWTFGLVRRVLSATMKPEEIGQLAKKVQANYMLHPNEDVRKCSTCHTSSQRLGVRQGRHGNRVVCSTCTKKTGRSFEFCWLCGQPWRVYGDDDDDADDDNFCGNAECAKSTEQRLLTLQNCGVKTIGDVPECPDMRACPKCGLLISHIMNCKHIVCNCGHTFCFICLLSVDSEGDWLCGDDPYAACNVAPRQSALSSP